MNGRHGAHVVNYNTENRPNKQATNNQETKNSVLRSVFVCICMYYMYSVPNAL